jgi:hypothetical protein
MLARRNLYVRLSAIYPEVGYRLESRGVEVGRRGLWLSRSSIENCVAEAKSWGSVCWRYESGRKTRHHSWRTRQLSSRGGGGGGGGVELRPHTLLLRNYDHGRKKVIWNGPRYSHTELGWLWRSVFCSVHGESVLECITEVIAPEVIPWQMGG